MSHICCGQVYIYISWTNIYLFIINNVANWRPFCTLRTLSYQQLTTFMSNVLALLNFNTCWHLLMPFILWIFPRCRTDWTVLSRKNPVRNFGFDPVVVWNFGFNNPSIGYLLKITRLHSLIQCQKKSATAVRLLLTSLTTRIVLEKLFPRHLFYFGSLLGSF